MKAIQKELGDSEGSDELSEYSDKINTINLSKEAKEKLRLSLKAQGNVTYVSGSHCC